MSRYSINGFIEKTSQRDRNQGFFELENDRLLEINLNGTVWTKENAICLSPSGPFDSIDQCFQKHFVGKSFVGVSVGRAEHTSFPVLIGPKNSVLVV